MIKTPAVAAALAMLVFSGLANAAEDPGPAKANELAKDCRWWDTNNYLLFNGEAFTELLAKCAEVYGEHNPQKNFCEHEVELRAAAYGYCLQAKSRGGFEFRKRCSYEDIQVVLMGEAVDPYPVPVPRVGAQVCLAVCGCKDR